MIINEVVLPQKYLSKQNCDIPAGHFRLSCHFVPQDEVTWAVSGTSLLPTNSITTIQANTINEITSGAGVTLDGVIAKDGSIELVKGNVTQLTSITTGVTSTASSGTVTTVSSTIAAGASASFVVTNAFAKTTSKIFLNAFTSGNGIPYAVVSAKANGSFTIKLFNVDAAAALNNTVLIDFVIV